jgi:hypothetical protein
VAWHGSSGRRSTGWAGFSVYEMPTQLRERIAGDVQAVADPVVMERLTATGQVSNINVIGR